MIIEGHSVFTEIVDKQFEMIGETMTFERIPDTGEIIVGKKKVLWYNYYKFSESQDEAWRKWALEKLKESQKNPEKVLADLELKYGFILSYKKKGTLF